MAEEQTYTMTGEPLPPGGMAIYAQTEGDPPPHDGEVLPPDSGTDSGSGGTTGTTTGTTDGTTGGTTGTTTGGTTDTTTGTTDYGTLTPGVPSTSTEGDPPPH